jgi:hypothetical protein
MANRHAGRLEAEWPRTTAQAIVKRTNTLTDKQTAYARCYYQIMWAEPPVCGQLANNPVRFADNVVRRTGLFSGNPVRQIVLFAVSPPDVCGLLHLPAHRRRHRDHPRPARSTRYRRRPGIGTPALTFQRPSPLPKRAAYVPLGRLRYVPLGRLSAIS